MARLKRICLPGIPQHIIQRGNNRQVCFIDDNDFAAYAHWLDKYAKQHKVAIHAWVFMTNHVHLLVTPNTNEGISKVMQALGRDYVRYFNNKHGRTGTLWEGRFKSCVIDRENYLFTCQQYIEMNPVRAGMVENPEDYIWSSYGSSALGRKTALWMPHPIYNLLGNSTTERTNNYRAMFKQKLAANTLSAIRTALNQGMVLGSNDFKQKIARLSGRRTSLLMRGPQVK
ncbi:MAG: transposase [Sulfuriflexus sp.]|nr:transposase [Sulfuriflexus sp.]